MDEKIISKDEGLRRLIQKGREAFRIPENTKFYASGQFKLAEKKYIKFCILEGKC